MTKPSPKLALSLSRDIPFDKLVLSESNVRHVKAGVGIEDLAEDIARRTLLQSLVVRPMLDASGAETGLYEIPAGGRRYRALEFLVRQKRLAKTAPIPCVIRDGGLAEEDSLAENVQRAPLHPLDQYRAFATLRERGLDEETIAAAFFVDIRVVRQRLKLAAISPRLLDAYADEKLMLDQLIAFSVNEDHGRQEQVFERISQSWDNQPASIRRMLTEHVVKACDKRARLVGEDYVAVGGAIMRDLFSDDGGGWLSDVGLVERLVAERLEREAEAVRAEGWKWVQVALDLPYDAAYGLRQIRGEPTPLTEAEEAARAVVQAEYDAIEAEYGLGEELPEEADRRLGELETRLEAFEKRPLSFDPAEVARAGALISVDREGAIVIDRGYVRREDELPVIISDPEHTGEYAADGEPSSFPADGSAEDDVATSIGRAATTSPEPEEDEGMRPIPDRVVTELTAHRTLALRDAVGERPEVALLAVVHALALATFYTGAGETCVEVTSKSVRLVGQAPGLAESDSACLVDARHRGWAAEMPRDPADLWDVLSVWTPELRGRLLAHCVGQSVNAVSEAYYRRPRALAHADQLAKAVALDMVQAGWTPTAVNFLGRVTKGRIVQAVREGVGGDAAERIAGYKKEAMVEEAERLLAGSGWLPEPLRTPGWVMPQRAAPPMLALPGPAAEEAADQAFTTAEPDDVQVVVEDAVIGGERSMVEEVDLTEDEPVAFEPHAVAAE